MSYLSICDNGCGKTFPTDRGDCPHCGVQSALCASAPLDARDWGYDIETFPNTFTARFTHAFTRKKFKFEISDRVNQATEFVEFLYSLKQAGARGVGYNNIGFDYPVIHAIAMNPSMTVEQIYDKAMSIIKGNDRFGHMIWESDRLFEQIDLFKIHHFDNPAKSTSLKQLEMWMGFDDVRDLPFDVGKMLTDQEKDILLDYNDHDVHATLCFFVRSLDMIKLREGLSEKFGQNFMNCSDVKMGELILISEMQKNGIECYEKINGRKTKKQTFRHSIPLKDVIFPYVKFERPEFQSLKELIEGRTITKVDDVLKTKGLLKGAHAIIEGVEYKIGTGGIHASVESCTIRSTDTIQIVDVDVASFYPNLSIVNKTFPAHLGAEFCDAYHGIYQTRKTYAKKTQENGAFKLALNGAYGNSNNKYSPLYDPKYTMTTTINGQLLLCMLIEQMLKVPGLKMIQANTDGITYLCPVEYLEHQRTICRWWEQVTCLVLEEALYDSMHIRDVNNYMAVYTMSGAVKRIGCYAHETAEQKSGTRELPWNKDWSARVVQLAAEAALIRGEDVRTFITNHDNLYDFTLRAKVPRSSSLVMRYADFGVDMPLQNIIRYYISTDGGNLVKISPPTGEPGTWKRKPKVPDEVFRAVVLEITQQTICGHEFDAAGVPHDERIHTKNKSQYDTREMGVSVGWKCTDCSNITDFSWSNLNREYYIAECEKIVNPLLTGKSI